ncbi:MAG: hypothetical protein FJ358_03465 [Thaumarchaeota archaeon]|nr:hypothetical protein [Nitrososphaerota archaeon]
MLALSLDSDKLQTLFIVIPYGIGWKTILNEKTVGYLTSRNMKLVIIAEPPDVVVSHPMVSIEKLLPYDRGKFEVVLGILRNFVFADTSKKHAETLELKMKIYERNNKTAGIIRKLFGKRLSKSKAIRSLLAWLDQNLFGDGFYGPIFEKYKPDTVLITYPFSYHIYPILRRAAKSKVPTIAYVPSWDNLTSKWEVPAKFSRMIVWNQIMKNEAVEFLDYKPDDVQICGVPQFDLYADPSTIIPKKDFLKTIGANPKKKLLLYCTGTPALYKDESDIVQIIYDAIVEGKFSKPCQLLIRLHPRRDRNDFEVFEGKQDVMIQTPGTASSAFAKSGYFWVSDTADYRILANTIAHCGVMINVASTVTIESCILDRPVVNIGFDGKNQREYHESVRRYFDYTHYRPIVQSGGVRIAWSKEELVKIINAYLEDDSLDAEGRKKVVGEQCYRMDGEALDRMLEFVSSFVNTKTLIAKTGR